MGLTFLCHSPSRQWSNPATDALTGLKIEQHDSFLEVRKGPKKVATLALQTAPDPQSLLASDGVLIYTTGGLMLARFDPKTEGQHTYEWFSSVRRVRGFSLTRLKALWNVSQSKFGLPIWMGGGKSYAISVANLRACFCSDSVLPRFLLLERDVKSVKVKRTFSLIVKQADARIVFWAWLRTDPPEVTSVKISKYAEVKHWLGYDSLATEIKNYR